MVGSHFLRIMGHSVPKISCRTPILCDFTLPLLLTSTSRGTRLIAAAEWIGSERVRRHVGGGWEGANPIVEVGEQQASTSRDANVIFEVWRNMAISRIE